MRQSNRCRACRNKVDRKKRYALGVVPQEERYQELRQQTQARREAQREAKRKAKEETRLATIAKFPWRAPGLTAAQRFRLRYRHDADFAIAQRLRAAKRRATRDRYGKKVGDQIRYALVHNGRAPSIVALFGYTIAQLKRHLERQFTPDMSWDAFCKGQIHIDHIVPLALCNDDPEQWRAAWALTNLRPLWEADNLRKGKRRTLLL